MQIDTNTSFDHLPEHYRTDDGDMVKDPCWRLLAQGYYNDTLWLDGEIIATEPSFVPNHHLEPLNKAAGEAMQRFLISLPLQSSGLRQEDMIEAAYMMRPREGEKELTHEQWSNGVIRLALELKAKREGTGQLRIPELQGVRAANRASAAPMPNALFTDPRQQSFGQQQGKVMHQPQAPDSKRVKRVVPAAGNMPAESASPRA